MKRSASILMLLGFWIFFTTDVSAQITGKWVSCKDPSTGYLVQCFIPDNQSPYVIQNQTPVQQDSNYYPTYYEEPVYQRQRARTTRQEYDVGLSPYGRPFGRYTRTTQTTTIVVETNAPSYRPEIRYDINSFTIWRSYP